MKYVGFILKILVIYIIPGILALGFLAAFIYAEFIWQAPLDLVTLTTLS